MEPFHLTEDAILDIHSIWLYVVEKQALETADSIVTELFKGFYKLSDFPNIGHRRADLTDKSVLFYKIFSYLVIYSPGSKPLQILSILHGKRNISRILKRRQ